MNNRIFKFRVWDKLAKHMIYPDKGYQGHYILDLNGRFHNLQNGSGGDDYVVMEYTGLTDSQGNPICEGDIVKDTWKENRPYSYSPDEEYDCEKIFEVKYEDYSFNLDRKYSREQTCVDDFHREVIGNIFEHKHLLEK